MTPPGTHLFRTCNRCKNGSDSSPESSRTDHPLGNSALFADHEPEKALEVTSVNRANRSRFAASMAKGRADESIAASYD